MEMDSTRSDTELHTFRRDCIELFVHAAQLLSVPRSIGEIYGLLYASPEPLPMESIMEELGMSKGSVSQGLRWLRDIGAVRSSYVHGDRRDHFAAVAELRRLAQGFLQERVVPHLHSGEDRVQQLRRSAREISGPHQQFVVERADKIRSWHRFASKIIPLFLRIAGKI